MVTNGCVKDSDGTVNVSQSQWQLLDILETMARVEPSPAGNMIDILQHWLVLSRNTTGIYFTYKIDSDSLALYQFLKYRRIPVVTIVCNHGADNRTNETEATEDIYWLDDIRAKEVTLK